MLYSRLLSIFGIVTAIAADPIPQSKGKGAKGPRPIGVTEGCSKFEMIVGWAGSVSVSYDTLTNQDIANQLGGVQRHLRTARLPASL
jgi:hypothetical protein